MGTEDEQISCKKTVAGRLRRGPLTTAIPRVSAGGLKPEIVARVWKDPARLLPRLVVKDSVRADLGRPGVAALRNTHVLCRALQR